MVFETPADSGDPLACVELAGSQVLLGTSEAKFLPPESRPHKGAGVEFHVTVPASDITKVYEAHRAHADSVTELTVQPWGETAFHATFLGYRFLLAAEAEGPGRARPEASAAGGTRPRG